jgi:hypothetical protein
MMTCVSVSVYLVVIVVFLFVLFVFLASYASYKCIEYRDMYWDVYADYAEYVMGDKGGRR